MKTIGTTFGDFTKARYDKFVKEYNKAVKAQKEVFTFDETPILTKLAKYLIEYLDPTFKNMK